MLSSTTVLTHDYLNLQEKRPMVVFGPHVEELDPSIVPFYVTLVIHELVVVATTTLQNFALASFWSFPSKLHSSSPCFIKFTSFSVFLAQRKLVDHNLIHSPHRLFTWTWSSCKLSSFPKKIVLFLRETNLISKNCAILFGSMLGFRIAQSFQSTLLAGIVKFSQVGLLSPEFVQIWATISCCTRKLCKSLW